MNLPPTNNINGVLLSDQPGAPNTYQAQVSMQQAAKSQEVQSGTALNQNIAAVRENMRRAAATQNTAEGKANAMAALGTATVQQLGGQRTDRNGLEDPELVRRMIFGS